VPTGDQEPTNLEGLFDDTLPEDPLADPNTPQGALAEVPVQKDPFNWLPVYIALGALATVVVAGLAGRTAWNWGLGGLDGRAKLWAKTQRLAGWAKLGSRQHETPREWSRRMGRAIDQETAAIQLSDAYEEARYGRPDLVRIDDADAESSYRSLRSALVAKLSRRKQRRKA
jgi:hypothetical protein